MTPSTQFKPISPTGVNWATGRATPAGAFREFRKCRRNYLSKEPKRDRHTTATFRRQNSWMLAFLYGLVGLWVLGCLLSLALV